MVRKLYLGLNDLEHYCQWLYDLWLEATLHDSLYRWSADDGRFFFSLSPPHVINLPRADVRGLVAAKTRILKKDSIARILSL
jgi:hypothetical protein